MRSSKGAGFSLIELMIVVAILGLLAAIGLPSMQVYIRRAKAAEAYEDIKQIFNQAATYYARERADSGLTAITFSACTVASADNAVLPRGRKQDGDYDSPSFLALGFTTVLSYYRYELDNKDGAARCNVLADTSPIYLIRARGDLDEDGVSSIFELATGSNADNELFHAQSFYVVDETE